MFIYKCLYINVYILMLFEIPLEIILYQIKINIFCNNYF